MNWDCESASPRRDPSNPVHEPGSAASTVDIIDEFRTYGLDVHVHDPVANGAEAKHHYGLELADWDRLPQAEALVVAVAHTQYVEASLEDLTSKVCPGGSVIDVKSILDREALLARGLAVWRL